MASFQKIIALIAFILLIITLVSIGIILSKAKTDNWPPTTADCPDYWLIDGSGNNSVCINIKDLGKCPPQSGKKHLTMNFNESVFTGSSGKCNKYNWAKTCGISWDGITYGVSNPCQTTT